jgi:very-short-patch-repair endonuclease
MIQLPDLESDSDPASIADWLRPVVNELRSLRQWLEVAQRRLHLKSDGIDGLVSAFENAQLPLDRLPETFGALAFHYRASRARQRREVLRKMTSLDLENERARFVASDEMLKKRQREAVRMKLLKTTIPAGSGIGPRRDWTDSQCLRNEFTKQAKHLPIRRLLSRSGKAVQAMKPCFMMSPLSLAKFLPSRIINFDLLVIDEASQMRPEDSLGGLLRVKKVVVVGDPNQLPPTDFFSRVTPADEGGAENEDEADDINAESILDWSLKTFQAPRRLKWHYRSRCESLIAFSNREFYSSKPGSHGDLVTFPNAQPESFAIDLVRVNGNYKASRNPAEVARIVEAAIDFMIQHADLPDEEIPTLGIVAINIEQRDAIREEFNRSGRDETIERYLSACNKGTSQRGPEPFFIKNLENVQGDERDFIMISLTYGREVGQERVAQRFGPIARSQGHRRLNVLFTRARQRIVLFSSMGSDDVLVSPTTKRGVRVLRDYLRYVESRRLEVGITTGRDFDSDFERDVRCRLEIHDFIVDPQVGVAGYRVDLGVRHPDHATIYLAGIECDGATFHSAKSARDRDRLRESVLRGKGWNILRVWSTDWFADADLQTDRLVSELRRLAVRSVLSQSQWTIVSGETVRPAVVSERSDEQNDDLSFSRASLDGFQASVSPQSLEKARPSESEVKNRLRAFRDAEIIRDFPQLDPERCILRDIMINKMVESKFDDPEDFTRKIPLWLRERTDQKQMRYLEQICSIVEHL